MSLCKPVGDTVDTSVFYLQSIVCPDTGGVQVRGQSDADVCLSHSGVSACVSCAC